MKKSNHYVTLQMVSPSPNTKFTSDEFVPVIMNIVNSTLLTGSVQQLIQLAIINLMLKMPSLD